MTERTSRTVPGRQDRAAAMSLPRDGQLNVSIPKATSGVCAANARACRWLRN